MGLEAAAAGPTPGFVENPDRVASVPAIPQDLGDMADTRIEVPGEAGVGETQDTRAMRVTSGEQCRPGWGALGGGAEMVFEQNAAGGEPVQIGGMDRRIAVATEMSSQVVAVQYQ